MDAISATLALKNLDGLVMRQKATAENIANAGTPGYRPLRVTFEEALVRAATDGPAAIAAVQPELIRAEPDPMGSDLRIDLELVTAAATTGRYGFVVELLNRQLQMNALAISGVR